jgi:hypothetical protein
MHAIHQTLLAAVIGGAADPAREVVPESADACRFYAGEGASFRDLSQRLRAEHPDGKQHMDVQSNAVLGDHFDRLARDCFAARSAAGLP